MTPRNPKARLNSSRKPFVTEERLEDSNDSAWANIAEVPQGNQSQHSYNDKENCNRCGWERRFIEKTNRVCLSDEQMQAKHLISKPNKLDFKEWLKVFFYSFAILLVVVIVVVLLVSFFNNTNALNFTGELFRGTFMTVAGIFELLVLLGIYFIPTLITKWRGHKNVASVFVINLVFGWTLIGWVFLLAYALKSD